MLKTAGHISMVVWYPLKKTVTVTSAEPEVPASLARFAAQGPSTRILMDSALEVVGQMESMNLIDSSSVTDTMRAVFSVDLAMEYPHLLWALLNELFVVQALTATDMVLSVPVVLRVLGPEVALQALKFISNGTIWATPINKLLLEGKLSSLAVNAIRCARCTG
uniref:Uncharacterized protein n=1 Tax=Romanomermis culicivorax TaxID=13658 RepID=A0A915KRX6_ROMCU